MKKLLSFALIICVAFVASGCAALGLDSEKRIDDLERECRLLQQELTSKNEQIAELESKLEQVEGDVADLESEIDKLKKEIEALRKQLNEHINGPEVVEDGDLSIHFLELGNKYTGDSVYISYGDIDILIDAGSKPSSAAVITRYIDNYITDGKLEFVIATHAHEDHISGFYSSGSGSNKIMGVLDAYEIGMIIDYPKTNSTSNTRANYETTRDRLVAETGTEHYTALECYKEINGGQREYQLGEGVKLEILYNYYYEKSASTENDYSVCLRIVQDGNQYLFTGDLEKSGEDKLVDYYDENHGGLGEHVLYKGGHHGSSTSSNEKLMAEISPEYIIICTCAGSPQYTSVNANQFPTQQMIDRVAPYTDKVYITTLMTDYSKGLYESMNGNIIFIVDDGEISINCSNNNQKLKDTEWFLNNRTMPSEWASVG